MKIKQKIILCLCVIVVVFQSCKEADSSNQQQSEQQTTVAEQSQTNEYLLTSDSFYGLKKGQKIPENLEKSVLETGEGDFEIFLIKDKDGSDLGYIHPDFMKDEALIGNIVVTSSKVATIHGLSIDMTFGDIQEKYPNVEVHGSEIEGYTSAVIDDIHYGLEFNHWSYDLDAKLISKDTRITEISN